jgi:histidyl-tRNA synthetase
MSGFRDLLAEQVIPRQEMLDTISREFAAHGFVPLETPILERLETLRGKYGAEGEGLIYKLQDNGGRELALRYDHTVPLARVVGQHGHRLPMPYKRWVIGPVFRGESPQAGRYRQFTQCDVDIVGTASPVADAEVISMIADSMEALEVDSVVRVNNRQILDGLAAKAGIRSARKAAQLMTTIDKTEKIGVEAVLGEITKNHGAKAAGLVGQYLAINGSSEERLDAIALLLDGSGAASEGIQRLREVFEMLRAGGYKDQQIVLDPTIARGLSYYTGTVFETSIRGAEELGSVCSGGRYDNLIRDLGGPDLPAVGTSFGVDRLMDVLNKLGKVKEVHTPTQALVTNFGLEHAPHYLELASVLRRAGVSTEVYYDPVKMQRQLKFASGQGIPIVVIAGPNEIARGSATVRSMTTRNQAEVTLDGLAEYVKHLLSDSR